MRPGPLVRSLFGPYEHGLMEAYRKIFVNLDDFTARLRGWVPRASRILEVGCGEGSMTERLSVAYPDATITAIDVTPRLGRLYQGDTTRVSFCQRTVDDVARQEPSSFDLVVLCDVLHHVAPIDRLALLSAIDRAMAPDGSFVLKDWAYSRTPIHLLNIISDRYLTWDDVHFPSAKEVGGLLGSVFGSNVIQNQGFVRPWSNNIVYLVRR